MMHGRRARRRPLSSWLATAYGVWCVGLGAYFVFIRPPLLPEDPRFMGVAQQTLLAVAPGLPAWLGKVFTVLGGFMAGTGVLTVQLGWRMLPARLPGTATALALSGLLSVGVMSAVNFALHSDFRWLLTLPVAAWMGALAAYWREGR